jgi:hypothetical protein
MIEWKVYRAVEKNVLGSPAILYLHRRDPLIPNLELIKSELITVLTLDTENTWSWPLILDRAKILEGGIRSDLESIVSRMGLQGIQHFAVFHVEYTSVSGEDVSKKTLFYLPSELIPREELLHEASDVFHCGGCDTLQTPDPENSNLCRFGHLREI